VIPRSEVRVAINILEFKQTSEVFTLVHTFTASLAKVMNT
jgi:hypothetical protein